MVAGCSGTAYTPKLPIPEIPSDPGGGGGGGGGEEEDWGESNMTVYFYLNNSNSEVELARLDWWALRVIGAENIPEAAKLTDADAPDPRYPHFLGYSEYPSSIDESHLWDFEKDTKQSNILSLYGIWVSND